MAAQKHNRENDSYGAIAFAESKNGPVVLMVHARNGWSFPKGHHERGESPAQCAERETMEETGIKVHVNTAFVSASPDANGKDDRTVYFFTATSSEAGKTPVSDEVDAAEWVPVEEAEERILFEADRNAFLKARAFLKERETAKQPKHILITAEKRVGKSTLIRRLLNETDAPLYGYYTTMGPADTEGFHDIYLQAAGSKQKILCGRCDTVTHIIHTEVFDGLGADAITAAQPGGIVVMDELGFMEKNAETFKTAVKNALAGDIPVIAAVKDRYDIAFLNELRAMPTVRVIDLTEENRDALFAELLPVVKSFGK